jgi:mono/diheme cytochrome c family protein
MKGHSSALRTDSSPLPVSLFRTHCLKCHDGDGSGEITRDVFRSIPDFTDARWQASKNDTRLKRAILEGQGKSMPAMKDKLSQAEAGRLVLLVRAFRGGRHVISEEEESPEPKRIANATPAPVARAVSPSAPKSQDSSIRLAGALFQRSCRNCHGSDGKGSETRALMSEIPDFTNRAWQEHRDRAELIASVLEGKGSHMPAFRDKLSAEQSRAIVDLIRTFGPPQAGAAATTSDEFDARFTRLRREFEALQREYQALLSTRPSQREARRDGSGGRNH